MKKIVFSPPARTALIYLVVSVLWVLFSDKILDTLVADRDIVSQIQTVKGWIFVSASALLIYSLTRREMRTVRQKNVELQEWGSKLEDRVAERTAELHDANAKLRERENLKSRLIAEISHELRTPITSMNLKLDILGRVQPEKQQIYIDGLKKQAQQLSSIIEDVMDISWLVEGEAQPAPAAVNLDQLVTDVLDLHRPMAEAAHIELDFQNQLDSPVIRGQAQQLNRMISNLVGNAIKFTSEGTVGVVLGNDAEKQQVIIRVKDSGVGISAKDQARLFDRFFRTEQAKREDVPGSGLGLSIVKTIVDSHGGTIGVESELEKGTTFIVYLPINPPQTS